MADINYDYQLQFEKDKMERNYYKIGQFMLNLLNTGNNFGYVSRKTKHFIEECGIAAPAAQLWTVTYMEEKDCQGYCKIIIHNGNDRYFIGDEAFYFCFIPLNEREYELVESVDKYKDICAKAKAKKGIGNPDYLKALEECRKFVETVRTQLTKARESRSIKAYTEIMEQLTKDMPFGDKKIHDAFINNKGKALNINKLIVFNFEEILDRCVNSHAYKPNDVLNFKNTVKLLVRACYDIDISNHTRRSLLNILNNDGIQVLIKDVEILSTQNLGDYDYITNVIKNGISVDYQKVIKNSFSYESNPETLKQKILGLLKALYDLNNIDERNSEYLTQFLLEYGITKGELVDKVIKEKPETLGTFWGYWDQSEKQKHKSAIERDRSCTFKIVKMVYVKRVVYGSIPNEEGKYDRIEANVTYGEELLKKMRAIAQLFNEKSDIAYINSITEGNDGKESFVFDFVTFKDDKDINGTRLSEFTRMFNQAFEPERLYLSYSKEDLNDIDIE